MMLPDLAWRGGGAILGAVLCTAWALAQSAPPPVSPLRTAPVDRFTVNPGFRDWTATTIAGTTILGGNSTGRGGLFAVDMLTGKVKWTSRPTGNVGTSVGTAPVVSGDIVIAIMGDTLVGFSLATGKEVSRGPATKLHAGLRLPIHHRCERCAHLRRCHPI